ARHQTRRCSAEAPRAARKLLCWRRRQLSCLPANCKIAAVIWLRRPTTKRKADPSLCAATVKMRQQGKTRDLARDDSVFISARSVKLGFALIHFHAADIFVDHE